MLISENWLRSWIDTQLDINQIAEHLTMLGIEVDSINSPVPQFSKVVLGKVFDIQKHPNADKLLLCKVDVGLKLNIICGAKNVEKNMLVACALDGAVLPSGTKIKKSKMRGLVSEGMLCSEKELGISDQDNGIMSIDIVYKDFIGKDIRDLLDLDEKILDLKITPNRGDCLSVRGIARELATVDGIKFKKSVKVEKTIHTNPKIHCPVFNLHNKNLCGRFSARVIKNINPNIPTPDWIVKRLVNSGQKPISILVDISNYIMLEIGRPSHVFDLNRISLKKDKSIDVRWAKDTEQIELLNNKSINCSSNLGVIADSIGPIAVAGIMGGSRTAVSEDTKDILIETAFWWPDAIRGRAQKIRTLTDASHRFERGVDFKTNVDDLNTITSLIISLCGGDAGEIVDYETKIPQIKLIKFRKSRCEKILGISVSSERVAKIFESLNITIEKKEKANDDIFHVTPPTYRFDLQIEEDLIEEVVRLIGYNNIPVKNPISSLSPKVVSETLLSFKTIRERMIYQDFYEVINYGFIDEKFSEKFFPSTFTEKKLLRLINPISSNMSVMRHSLIPGLIKNLVDNLKNQQKRLRIFELGRVFYEDKNVYDGHNSVEGVCQPYVLSGLIYGPLFTEQWGENLKIVDFFDIKKVLENLQNKRQVNSKKNMNNLPFLHPGRSAFIPQEFKQSKYYGPFSYFPSNIIGFFGEIHPEIVSELDLPHSPVVFEVDALSLIDNPLSKYEEISKVPTVRRDLAFTLPIEIESDEIIKFVLKSAKNFKNGKILKNFELFDLYKGEGIASNEKSLAFRVLMQDTEKTLEEKFVQSLIVEIVKIIENEFNAKIRS